MLGNKVSPATLYLLSDSSVAAESTSGTEDSQMCNSQASLFSSEPPSSMELFPDIHSQPQVDKIMQRSTTQQHRPRTVLATADLKNPEIPLNRKFYLKYLNCANKQEPQNISRCDDSRTSNRSSQSGPAYEAWRTKQAVRSESQQFMSDVQKAVREGMKEVRDELRSAMKEGLKECKEELRSEIEGLRSAMSAHQSEIAANQQMLTQVLSNLVDLKQCLEEHICESKETLTAKIDAHGSLLTQRLDQQTKDLHQKTQSIKDHIEKTHTLLTNLIPELHSIQNRTEEYNTRTVISREERPLEADQAVPCQQVVSLPTDITNTDLSLCLNKPIQSQADSLNKEAYCTESRSGNSQAATDQSSCSTTCDVDLSKQSPSACSQAIAHILRQEDSIKCNTTADCKDPPTEVRRGPKRRRIQRQRATQPTPIRRRSQRIRRNSRAHHQENLNISLNHTAEPRKGVQREVDQTSTHRSVASSDVRTPRSRLDACFFSQTPHIKEVSEHSSPQIIEQPSATGEPQLSSQNMGKFHRSTEAAKRRVKVFAGLSNATSTAALLELSNSIKTNLENYMSNESP